MTTWGNTLTGTVFAATEKLKNTWKYEFFYI